MRKKIVSVLIILLLIVVPVNKTYAKTLKDMDNELAALQKSYNEAKNKANLTQAELNKLKASISTTEAEIKTTMNDIAKAEQDIKDSEASIEEKKEQTNQLLLYLQLSDDDSSYMEYLFEADDYTDFIYRYSIVTQLSDYNKKLMDELNALIAKLETDKKNLANKQTELEQKKSDLQSKYAIIQVQYKEEQDDGLDLQNQISEMKKLISSYEKSCGGNRNIDVSQCGAPAVDGWYYPLNSFYQSSNYGWDENRYHYAVDLATSEGSEVKAVANGTVIASSLPNTLTSCYSKYTGKYYTNCHCGGYVIQIKHTYDGSDYVSLYMHLLTGYVSVGDVVTAGQVIGLSGGGYSEVEKWHDHCTFGAHLHFTMSYGDGYIGPSGSPGSTFDPVRFFPAMRGIGSSYSA